MFLESFSESPLDDFVVHLLLWRWFRATRRSRGSINSTTADGNESKENVPRQQKCSPSMKKGRVRRGWRVGREWDHHRDDDIGSGDHEFTARW